MSEDGKQVSLHRDVVKDYPTRLTVVETLMMMSDQASIKSAQAQQELDFIKFTMWNEIHLALEECAVKVSLVGNS